jgi:hypothetical protein
MTSQVADKGSDNVPSIRWQFGPVIYLIAIGAATIGWAWLIGWLGLVMLGS